MDGNDKKFYAALRQDTMRPTSVLRIDGALTSNINAIHQRFLDQWRGVYNRLEGKAPCYDTFKQEYSQHYNAKPAGDVRPTAEQLYDKARTATKDASAGRDAWRLAEVALLPSQAWQHRKRALDLVIEEGRWPKAYHEVVSPCLRKFAKLDPKAG